MNARSGVIEITDLSHDGRGVGRQGAGSSERAKACFVRGALPGETVRWRVTQSKRSFDEGEVVEVLTPSVDRVVPKCEYIGSCGGCELQHLDSNAQTAAKQKQLETIFQREHLAPDRWLQPLAGNAWEYRRRTRLSVAFKGQNVIIGYRHRSSKRIANIDHCLVLEKQLSALIQPLKEKLSGWGKTGLNEIELVAGDNDIAVCLNVRTLPDENLFGPITAYCDQESIQLWIREGRSAPAAYCDYEPLCATLDGKLSMQFTPAQFVQINADMNRHMIQQALELIDIQAGQSALDLFCGAGNFSLPMAKQAAELVGLEGMPGLIAQADVNAQRQGFGNTEFRVVDLSDSNALAGKRYTKGTFDRVLLDPPRSGALALMPALAKMKAAKVLYVSCHAATMARDAKMLVEAGYKMTAAGMMDMFPQTNHLETMALFEID